MVEFQQSLAGGTIEKAGESLGKVGEVVPLSLPVADPDIARRATETLELTRQPRFVNAQELARRRNVQFCFCDGRANAQGQITCDLKRSFD